MRQKLSGNRPGFWLAMIVGAQLSACSGSGAGLDSNGRPIVAGGGGDGPLTADFDSIQAHVFTPICTVCHAGAGAPQGLRLDSANSYSLLVGVPSTEVPSILRVKPGDPDNSYIVQKLEGHAAVGAQMPFGGPPLSADVIAVIRQWITDGAQRSVSAAAPALHALTISAVAPARGDVLIESPPVLMIEADQEIDATRIDNGSVRIEQVTMDSMGTRLSLMRSRIVLPPSNSRAMLIAPAEILPPGHYRVVLRGEALGAAAMDGESPADRVVTEFDVETAP